MYLRTTSSIFSPPTNLVTLNAPESGILNVPHINPINPNIPIIANPTYCAPNALHNQ